MSPARGSRHGRERRSSWPRKPAPQQPAAPQPAPNRPGPRHPGRRRSRTKPARTAPSRRRHRTAPRWKLADLSLDERIARGKAARQSSPRSGHGRWEPARRPTGSGRAPPGAGRDPGAGAGPDPLRPDARLAVHLLPRRRPDHGGRPGRRPQSGITVQLCGDAHLSNFGVFGSPERQAHLRHQRLRRDAARPVGVGREAAGGQLRGRRPRPRVRRRPTGARSSWPRSRRTGSRCARAAGMRTLDAWYAHLDVDAVAGRDQAEVRRQSGWARRRPRRAGPTGQGPDQRDSVRVLGKRAGEVDGRAADRRATPPLIVPLEDLMLDPGARAATERADPAPDRRLPADAGPTTTIRSRSSTTCTWPARSSASAASGRGAGSC